MQPNRTLQTLITRRQIKDLYVLEDVKIPAEVIPAISLFVKTLGVARKRLNQYLPGDFKANSEEEPKNTSTRTKLHLDGIQRQHKMGKGEIFILI